MGRSLIPERLDFSHTLLFSVSLWGISPRFRGLSPAPGQISYVLLTRAPLSAESKLDFPFNLHVLGTPPAFILSQDQTLHRILFLRGPSRLHSSIVKLPAIFRLPSCSGASLLPQPPPPGALRTVDTAYQPFPNLSTPFSCLPGLWRNFPPRPLQRLLG